MLIMSFLNPCRYYIITVDSSVRSDYKRGLSKPRDFLSLSVASSQLKLACLALVRLVVFTLRYTQ